MFVRGLKAPCSGCTTETGRSANPNCHSYCEKYLNYCEQNKTNKKIKNEIKKNENDYYSVRSSSFKKTQN